MSRDPNLVLDRLMEALKAGTPEFKSWDRKLKFWTDCSAFPCGFVRHIGFSDEWSGDGLQRIWIEAEVWFYAKTVAPETVPTEYATTLSQSVRAVFSPDDNERGEYTIGRLVDKCRIEGRTDLDSGDMDGYIKATMPVRILLP